MLNSLINYRSNTVNRSAGILTISAILSRFLGVARDWLLAKSFGAGPQLDIYFTAFKIPDFIYNILILGGMVVSFLPLFSDFFAKDKEGAWKFVSNCLNIFLVLLVGLSLILFFFTPPLIDLIAPGFNYEQAQKTIDLTRVMLLSPIFFGLSSIFSGVLQYFNRFLIYSLCPILYNLGIIFGILFLSPQMGISGVVIGVVFGSFLHFIIQIPSVLSCGFEYRKILNFNDKKIKKVFSLMLPRMFGVSVQQINLIVTNAIASTLAQGSIAIFNFANNIRYFPVGIIGVPFAVAAFPALSKNWAEEKKEVFKKTFLSALDQIVYFILPATSLIFVFREEIVNILLEHGLFSSSSAQLSSASLALFSFGVFFSSLIPLLLRVFFAIQDTKTPTLIAIFSMVINIGLSFLFTNNCSPCFQWFQEVFSLGGIQVAVLGLPLAFSVAAFFQFILMFIYLKNKLKLSLGKSIGNFLKILFSSIVLILISLLLKSLIESVIIGESLFLDFFKIIVIGFIGGLLYLLLTFMFSVPTTDLVLTQIFKDERN